MKRVKDMLGKAKATPEFWAGLGCLAAGVAVWVGILQFQVVLVAGVAYWCYQILRIFWDNPHDLGTKMIQCLLRLLIIISRLCLIWLVGINAQPYQAVVNTWNPDSALDFIPGVGWFFDNAAGYIIFAFFQGLELLAGLMLSNAVTFRVMMQRYRDWQATPGQDGILERAHRLLNGGDIIKVILVSIFAYIADYLFLTQANQVTRFGLIVVPAAVMIIVILFGFEVVFSIGNWLVSLEYSLLEHQANLAQQAKTQGATNE